VFCVLKFLKFALSQIYAKKIKKIKRFKIFANGPLA